MSAWSPEEVNANAIGNGHQVAGNLRRNGGETSTISSAAIGPGTAGSEAASSSTVMIQRKRTENRGMGPPPGESLRTADRGRGVARPFCTGEPGTGSAYALKRCPDNDETSAAQCYSAGSCPVSRPPSACPPRASWTPPVT